MVQVGGLSSVSGLSLPLGPVTRLSAGEHSFKSNVKKLIFHLWGGGADFHKLLETFSKLKPSNKSYFYLHILTMTF